LEEIEFSSLIIDVMTDYKETIKLIVDAGDKLDKTYNGLIYRPPGLIEITDYNDVYVIGDLHGDFNTLLEILSTENLFDRLENDNIKVVFLGDYVDRGDQQLEVLISVLYLKSLYPDKVVVLRGNHEAPPLLLPYPHDFSAVLRSVYGTEKGILIYRLFFRLFQRLPIIARIPGKILLLHGGPPSTVLNAPSFEEAFSIGSPCIDDNVLEEILWNDPVDADIMLQESPRGAGYLFGKKVTERALELSGTKYIVRAHEPSFYGYKVNHDGRVITLFDAKIPAYGIFSAAYLKISREAEIEEGIDGYIVTI